VGRRVTLRIEGRRVKRVCDGIMMTAHPLEKEKKTGKNISDPCHLVKFKNKDWEKEGFTRGAKAVERKGGKKKGSLVKKKINKLKTAVGEEKDINSFT